MDKTQKPKLAIIGTGIAGLSATWLLNDTFDVTVFESQPKAGMGVFSVDYDSAGQSNRIDIPLRIFCEGYYDNLMALYERVGVKITTSDHTGAFADGNNRLVFHHGAKRLGPLNLSYLKGRSLLSLKSWRMAWQSERFFRRARRDMKRRSDLKNISFGDYLAQSRAGGLFTGQILLPILSVTCTCDYDAVKAYPADIMLDYLTGGIRELSIFSAEKGVDDIVPRLLGEAKIYVSSPVAEITEIGDKLKVITEGGTAYTFDHVVVAAQAQQAAKMLSGFEAQRALLETVPFESSVMSVHTDTDILPDSAAPLAPVTYFVPDDEPRSEVSVDLTQAFARFKGQGKVFQTWNPIRSISPNQELARVTFTRPTVTCESRDAVQKLRNLQGQAGNRLWFCGSYMAEKIPLLDAAVDSSVNVANHLGVRAPWR